jgi:hypothetical protein
LYTELLDTYYVTMESFMNSQYGLNASTDAIIKSVSSSQELQQQVRSICSNSLKNAVCFRRSTWP